MYTISVITENNIEEEIRINNYEYNEDLEKVEAIADDIVNDLVNTLKDNNIRYLVKVFNNNRTRVIYNSYETITINIKNKGVIK